MSICPPSEEGVLQCLIFGDELLAAKSGDSRTKFYVLD